MGNSHGSTESRPPTMCRLSVGIGMSSYGYQKPLRAVNFICHATQATAVSLVGDFNEWNPTPIHETHAGPFLAANA